MKNAKRVLIITLVGLIMGLYLAPVVTAQGKININTASKAELVILKHIGEKIADRIIEYRKLHPFKSIENIMEVKGIGQKVFDGIKDKITVMDG